ncbi:hypothetical protein [Clostridium sp.]|uniref:hypothetical protein n=1 Tax=Clostridium sp. TaxID=1506 RepID=UPI00321732C2
MEDFINNKRNHHYISQAEQRLNALDEDPNTIYKFKKAGSLVVMVGEKAVGIRNNLSAKNLFTFSNSENGENYNFEDIFSRYENNITLLNRTFNKKMSINDTNLDKEIYEIFSSKFMNIIRNPYFARLVVEIFSDLEKFIPSSEDINFINEKIMNFENNNKDLLCQTFGFSEENYKKWLRIIFFTLGLYKYENGSTPIDYLIEQELLNTRNTIVKIDVYKYDNERCLISDRGFCELKVEHGFNLTFNIDKKCFASFTFVPGNGEPVDERESYFVVHENIIDELEKYNSACIEQSHEHVFCSRDQFLYSQEAL